MTEIKIKRALISVTDKEGIAEFGKKLAALGVEIISTGGTAAHLKETGVPVTGISEVTRFPEIMDGRVKTLHPAIHGGLLARRDQASHSRDMDEHGIAPIDLLVVNLYAFAEKAAEAGVTVAEAMEKVDIGGPCMIRAAAKNHAHVAVITDPGDYGRILEELDQQGGALRGETRSALALKAFDLTASYDAGIQQFLRSAVSEEPFPRCFSLPTEKGRSLRYGENPHQAAVFYPAAGETEPCMAHARQLGGKKELSYNNILDTDAAFELVKEFDEPAAVVVKHTNPCGAAVGGSPIELFERAYAGDPLSAFGGILALNRPVNQGLAEVIADPKRFLEVLIATDFSPEALEILRKKVKWGKNLRVLAAGALEGLQPSTRALNFRSVTGGVLVQQRDLGSGYTTLKTVSETPCDDATLADLTFAWKVVKHVKSNAIVLAKDRMVVGVGAGQMSRIDSTRIAGEKAGERTRGSVLASDAFFPFRDCVDQAAELGVRAVIQPGGSVRDEESIQAANEKGMVMVFTGQRHFKH